jgi:predicted acyltransferase
MEGNAVLRVDRWLLGDAHLYHGEGIAFDPEGLLSTMPAIGNVIGGYVAGKYIQEKGKLMRAWPNCYFQAPYYYFLLIVGTLAFPSIKNFGPVPSSFIRLAWIVLYSLLYNIHHTVSQ